MSKRTIRTIDDFVDEMGGTRRTAEFLRVGDAAVSQMRTRGYLPGGYHLTVLAELRRRRCDIHPDFFDLTTEEADILSDVLRPLPRRPRIDSPAA